MHRVRTPVTAAGIASGLVLLTAAVGFGRVDVAVAGVLLLVVAALAGPARRGGTTGIGLEREPAHVDADGGAVVPVRVGAAAPEAELIVITTSSPGHRARRTVLPGPQTHVDVRVRTAHSGDQDLLTVEGMALGRDGTWWAPLGPPQTLRARIEPHARTVRDLPLPRVPSGLTGGHDAPRPGDG